MTPITVNLDDETLAALDRMAELQEASRDECLDQIIRRFVEREAELREFIQVGIDSAERGDFIEQEEMRRWFEARYEGRAAAE